MTGADSLGGVAPEGAATCRSIVARAYYGMLDCGATSYSALDAAARVYLYHNPNETMKDARVRVEKWLNVQILQ